MLFVTVGSYQWEQITYSPPVMLTSHGLRGMDGEWSWCKAREAREGEGEGTGIGMQNK